MKIFSSLALMATILIAPASQLRAQATPPVGDPWFGPLAIEASADSADLSAVSLWAVSLSAVSLTALAQEAGARAEQRSRVVSVGKWVALVTSGAATIQGLRTNRSADREFEAIQEICEVTPERCAPRFEGGVFQDAALEDRYQTVLSRDRHARVWLFGGQVGIVGSVALFIFDLADRRPPDIPFDPVRIEVSGDRAELKVTLPSR